MVYGGHVPMASLNDLYVTRRIRWSIRIFLIFNSEYLDDQMSNYCCFGEERLKFFFFRMVWTQILKNRINFYHYVNDNNKIANVEVTLSKKEKLGADGAARSNVWTFGEKAATTNYVCDKLRLWGRQDGEIYNYEKRRLIVARERSAREKSLEKRSRESLKRDDFYWQKRSVPQTKASAFNCEPTAFPDCLLRSLSRIVEHDRGTMTSAVRTIFGDANLRRNVQTNFATFTDRREFAQTVYAFPWRWRDCTI